MHIEIYTIKGRKYKYAVSNYRIGKKVRHRKKYLGPVEPINKTQRKKSTGRPPSAFARKIDETEKEELENTARSNNAFARERAKIILHSAERMNVSEICKKMQREKRSILLAILEFNRNGLACLMRGKTTGRKPRFTLEQRAKIIEVVNSDPRKSGLNVSTWSLSKLKRYIIENKIVDSISIEILRQIIKYGNKKYKTSRKWLYSNDPEFAKKNS